MKGLHVIAFILLIVGGLNWGLVGLFEWDLVAWLGSVTAPVVATIIYILVGISALVELFTHKKGCKACDAGHAAPAAPPQGGPAPTI